MFTASSHIFKIKKKIIQVKCLAPNHVNHEYLQYINKSRFILYKNKDLVKQIEEIKKAAEIDPLHITCNDCKHEYNTPFTMNVVNFFV